MSRSGSLLMKLAEWWRELYRSRVAVEEIDRIGAGLIAHDVGLCPADLHNLAAKRSDATDLLCVHLAVLGIDQEELVRTKLNFLLSEPQLTGFAHISSCNGLAYWVQVLGLRPRRSNAFC
jgi:hypothetical protein